MHLCKKVLDLNQNRKLISGADCTNRFSKMGLFLRLYFAAGFGPKYKSSTNNRSFVIRVARWYIFKPKSQFGYILEGLGIFFQYFISICNILRQFGILYVHFGHLLVIWYIFLRLGMLYLEKSGSPVCDATDLPPIFKQLLKKCFVIVFPQTIQFKLHLSYIEILKYTNTQIHNKYITASQCTCIQVIKCKYHTLAGFEPMIFS
jgi:hypothetical protein